MYSTVNYTTSHHVLSVTQQCDSHRHLIPIFDKNMTTAAVQDKANSTQSTQKLTLQKS